MGWLKESSLTLTCTLFNTQAGHNYSALPQLWGPCRCPFDKDEWVGWLAAQGHLRPVESHFALMGGHTTLRVVLVVSFILP